MCPSSLQRKIFSSIMCAPTLIYKLILACSVTGMSFDHVIRHGNGEELDYFGMVMLITCKGQDTVEHWLSMSRESSIAALDLHESLLNMIQGNVLFHWYRVLCDLESRDCRLYH